MVCGMSIEFQVFSIRTFHNLLYPRPVQTDLPRNLSIAHAIRTHRQNISAELRFIRITQIAFG
jgi:hypothetical protein